MKLDKKTLEGFDSDYDAAAHVCLLYGAKRMLEFIDEPVAHTFVYRREADLPRIKTGDGVARMAGVYSRVPLSMLEGHPPFDRSSEVLVVVACEEVKKKFALVTPIDGVRQAASLTPCEVAICPSQSYNGRGCTACGAETDGIKKCSGCKIARYCSEACQRSDWREHRESCKKVQEAIKKAAER